MPIDRPPRALYSARSHERAGPFHLHHLLAALAVMALIGGVIGKFKGRVWGGVWWGLLLGPIGWLLVFLGPDCRPKCPQCRGAIDAQASVCPHCRSAIHPAVREAFAKL